MVALLTLVLRTRYRASQFSVFGLISVVTHHNKKKLPDYSLTTIQFTLKTDDNPLMKPLKSTPLQIVFE